MANGLIGIVLFLCYESHFVTGASNSVYVTIRGASVSDNGYIPFDLIGTGKNSEAVLCHTDDPTCCDKDQDNPGNWYYPDGSPVESFTSTKEQGGSFHNFARNRGTNESVVRLYRIKNNFVHERGRFRCDIHDAARNCHQLYVNILDIGAVSISRHNLSNTINGEIFNLKCSAEIFHNPLPENVSYPSFEWFYGPTNSSLPSGVTVSNITYRGNSYSSILQFLPLPRYHAGMYTCRLGGNERLAATIHVEASSEDYQTTMAEDSILKTEQNRILVFGIISLGLAAIILVGVVVILATLLLRKKLRVQLYTTNDQYHLYDIIFRHPLSTTSTDSVEEENKVPKVPVYEEIPLQDASGEKIEISRCPAYEASIITD